MFRLHCSPLVLTRIARAAGGSSQAPEIPAWATMAMVDGTMPVSLRAAPNGSTFSTTYARAAFEDAGGADVHVAPGGDDGTGTGAIGAPLRSIDAAVALAAPGDRIVLAAGRYPACTVGKSLSIVCETGDAYVGDLLSEAAITWGALASGRQTAALASGAIDGFCDLTGALRGWPLVAVLQANTTLAADRQAEGLPAIVTSTAPPTLGAFDGRDMSGEADTTLMVWTLDAAAPLTLSGAPKLFCRGVHFVGGAQIAVPSGARLVMEGCGMLGSTGQILTSAAQTLFVNGCARGARDDVLDYQAGARIVEADMTVDFGSQGGADNCSTGHDDAKILRVGGQYWDCPRVIHDINGTEICTVGATLGQTYNTGEALLKWGQPGELGRWPTLAGGITFERPAGTTYDIMRETGAGVPITYFGDTSALSVSGTVDEAAYGDDFSAAVLFRLDPSDLSTLWQDAAGTVPVTADGQSVLRIDDAEGGAGVALHRTGVGTAPVYRTGGGLHWLELAGDQYLDLSGYGARSKYALALFGLETSDTDFMLMAGTASFRVGWTKAGDVNGADNGSGAPRYRVDAGGEPATLTRAGLSAAIAGGSAHCVAARSLEISGADWDDMTLLANVASGRACAGKLHGFALMNEPRGAQFLAEEARMLGKAGL